jgi:hypothetical protein
MSERGLDCVEGRQQRPFQPAVRRAESSRPMFAEGFDNRHPTSSDGMSVARNLT